MLPSGHIAAGVLVGAERGRRNGSHPGAFIAGGIVVTCLPDLDLALPVLLDRIGVEHRLRSGEHHSWASHTPLFWALVATSARSLARRSSARWGLEAANLLAAGVTVHLVQDTAANTVALLWPVRRREYGLGLDRMPEVNDHLEYMRRYARSPAGKLEGAIILASAYVSWRQLVRGRRRA